MPPNNAIRVQTNWTPWWMTIYYSKLWNVVLSSRAIQPRHGILLSFCSDVRHGSHQPVPGPAQPSIWHGISMMRSTLSHGHCSADTPLSVAELTGALLKTPPGCLNRTMLPITMSHTLPRAPNPKWHAVLQIGKHSVGRSLSFLPTHPGRSSQPLFIWVISGLLLEF